MFKLNANNKLFQTSDSQAVGWVWLHHVPRRATQVGTQITIGHVPVTLLLLVPYQ